MRRLPVLPAAALLLFLSITSRADNLMDIYRQALETDPALRASEAELKAVEEQMKQARARFALPSVILSGESTANDQEISSSFRGGHAGFNNRSYSLSITQPVFHYDRFIALDQADLSTRKAQLQLDVAHQQLMLRVVEAYFNVLRARDEVEFARAQKEAFARQNEQNRQRFEVGLIAITDVQESQAAYDAAVADEIQALNALDNARAALSEVTGGEPGELAVARTGLPLVMPDPPDIEQWTRVALQQNLELRSQEVARQIAEREIHRQRAGHLPTLDAIASRGHDHRGGLFGSTDIDSASVGVQLTIPIYEGGQVLSRTREAAYRHDAAVQEEERIRRKVRREARDAFRGVVTAIHRVTALKQAVVSAETALRAIEAGLEVGTRTTVDVVDAQRQVFRSKRDYRAAHYDYLVNLIRFKLVAGTLSPEDLEKVNSWLQ